MSSKSRKYEKWVKASAGELRRMTLAADFTVAAAAEGSAAPTFRLVAYTGAPIRQGWSRNALVLDLAGMDLSNQSIPILFGHDASLESVVGQATAVTSDGSQLVVEGVVLGVSQTAERVLELARRGMRFQASVGADVGRIENIQAGESVQVNNRTFAGPVSIVRGSALRETSIVLMGADGATTASIAATQEDPMADTANQTPDETKVSAEATAPVAVETKPEVKAEQAKESNVSDLKAQLISEIKAELLDGLRASRPAAPAVHVVQKPDVNDPKVVTAALCMAGGLQTVEKEYDERTLEAAHKRSRTIGLQDVLIEAARPNGYDGPARIRDNGTLGQVLRAAFATHAISNVLAATYGKFLLGGFTGVESVWDMISSIRNVSDFKSVTGVRVNGGFDFEEVAQDGELKSADASDETRTIKAKTYGRISSLTRQDIINDDLGALTVLPTRLGRGAGLKLNSVFWSEFESSNSSYFSKETAAAGNALTIASLKTATTGYRKLTDPDGKPLAVTPRMLLVPPELEITAAELMGGSLLITGENSTRTNVNVLAGRYQVVSSAYLSSATTWWLVASPSDLPAMEVAFLNGVRVPTVEQAEADFNVLGVQMRGYFDFGVAKAESRGAYRMAIA
ncbi:MAG: Mu-like prophage major head subunit gpT family protein [Planctomycetes bacterium]|nr:Mu-like prophage major head subunit gpT family protein [Planctomycetota bacterium]